MVVVVTTLLVRTREMTQKLTSTQRETESCLFVCLCVCRSINAANQATCNDVVLSNHASSFIFQIRYEPTSRSGTIHIPRITQEWNASSSRVDLSTRNIQLRPKDTLASSPITWSCRREPRFRYLTPKQSSGRGREEWIIGG